MRNLQIVIQEMLKQIPASETDLLSDLESLRQSVSYTAPELMRLRWKTGADILSGSFPENKEEHNEWQKAVVDIWLDRKET